MSNTIVYTTKSAQIVPLFVHKPVEEFSERSLSCKENNDKVVLSVASYHALDVPLQNYRFVLWSNPCLIYRSPHSSSLSMARDTPLDL
jgi:hypothetical protein